MRSDKLARLIDPLSANGRDAVAPLPFDVSGRVERPRSTAADQGWSALPIAFLVNWPTGQPVNLPPHSRVPGLGDREPGSGDQVQVRVRVPNLAPEPDNPYPKPEARNLRPET
jgi:hypothetical protein